MRAMVLEQVGTPLQLREIDIPKPHAGQLLIRVLACGVCRTDLHIIDGELEHPKLPLILGHQIIGKVIELGKGVKKFKKGDRVGVPWLGKCCQKCKYCLAGRENLCDNARYTGYQIDGGFADYAVADEHFCFLIPQNYDDIHAAPLLYAGLIGFRAYRMVRESGRIGFYGFGSSAHLLLQIALLEKKEVYVFTREEDFEAQEFAKKLGATWVGSSEEPPPVLLDAAILFAPVGSLVPLALRAVAKAGVVVCAGIHMSDIPSFPYSLLWEERVLRSVANLTREDAEEFLALVSKNPIEVHTKVYPLKKANEALEDLRKGRLTGSAVLNCT